ncbi:ubiquitin-conjugating enzyme E2 Q2 isoform X3 [Hydra vulgaris]|uniref:Ubiquitin-conjugating enzyme E2 Q2 isoform X3 n=1 Tax=Hydra vulgaris TaxID=6087 RepID=A0ABM4DEI9_HYDVU
MTSRLKVLRKEIKYLKEIFSKEHSVMCIKTANVDDISLSYIGIDNKVHDISCSIAGMYPDVAPIWFSESEDHKLSGIIEYINTLSAKKSLLVLMATTLAIELYKLNNLEIPATLKDVKLPDELDEPITMEEFAEDEDTMHVIDEDDNFDAHVEYDADVLSDEKKEKEELGLDSFTQLQNLRVSQRQEFLSGRISGSVQATDRLMKELKNIYKSNSFKLKIYTIELKDGTNLYDWYVKLKGFDKESGLYKDLQALYKKDLKTDHICFNITYSSRFPMEPPFIRICYPVISGGYVLSGGALCMELLTPEGWSSAYSIEAVIMQISATLVKGKARVDFSGTKKVDIVYSSHKAEAAHRSLVKIHKDTGWFTPPKDEG